MNTAEATRDAGGLGRIWLFVPALWLAVGLAGFVALSRWPQLFAEPAPVETNPGFADGMETTPGIVSASSTELPRSSERVPRRLTKWTDGH